MLTHRLISTIEHYTPGYTQEYIDGTKKTTNITVILCYSMTSGVIRDQNITADSICTVLCIRWYHDVFRKCA